MAVFHDVEVPDYVIEDETGSIRFQSTHRQSVVMCTNNKNDLNQGEWFVDGMPAGGFNVHPIWWLDEEEIKKRRDDL